MVVERKSRRSTKLVNPQVAPQIDFPTNSSRYNPIYNSVEEEIELVAPNFILLFENSKPSLVEKHTPPTVVVPVSSKKENFDHSSSKTKAKNKIVLVIKKSTILTLSPKNLNIALSH
ncbi:hypothetical protein V6N13_116011 [Hibiscus sabdariffa]